MFTDEVTNVCLDKPGAERYFRGINLGALSACLNSDLAGLILSEDEYSSIELRCINAQQLRKSFLKKYEYSTNSAAESAALSKFLAVNERCKNWKLDLVSDEDHLLVGELKSILYHFCVPHQMYPILDSFDEIIHHGRTGPGASRGANGKDFYSKIFSSPLTSTSAGLYVAYKNYCNRLPTWNAAECNRADRYGSCTLVSGNKLAFVPKNVDIARTICVEPSLNMFFQLGVKHILEQRLRQFYGLDISKRGADDCPQQEKNRALAELGSMFDKSWVTIDLSSASDSLSCAMMKEVFPSNFLDWLNVLRSPTMELPDGSEIALNMISTMGNGYTFPLQTLLFASVVYAAHKVAGFPLERPRGQSVGNFGVYGDDIICRREVVDKVFRLLDILGFQVNADKTFVMGPFRESCGGDYFNGHQVRGVYVKRLQTLQDVYSVVNTLNHWSARTGIYLPSTVQYLVSWLRPKEILYVPPVENADAGIRATRHLISDLLVDPNVQSVKYRRYVPRPPRIRFGDGVVIMPGGSSRGKRKRRSKELLYNPEGLLLSLLQGTIRDSTISVRHDTVSYHLKAAITPYWDYLPELTSIALVDAQRRLGNAIEVNLGI